MDNDMSMKELAEMVVKSLNEVKDEIRTQNELNRINDVVLARHRNNI